MAMPRLLVIAALTTALLAASASAWTFNLDNMYYPPYSHDGYRPLPHWRIGVWDVHSLPSRTSSKGIYPFVDVDVTLRYTGRTDAVFYMYNIESIEDELYGDMPTAHPCMYAGQSIGVAHPDADGDGRADEMQDVVIFYGTNDMQNPDGSASDIIRIRERAEILKTGLYAFAFLQCRYYWVNRNTNETRSTDPANSDLWERRFDAGSNATVADGHVRVTNPYGELPGQAFGFVPWYALVFVFLFFLALVLAIRMCCTGVSKVMPYHWGILIGTIMTFFYIIFFLAYLGEINEKDEDKGSVYIAAFFFQRIRDGVARSFVGLLGLGYGVTRATLRAREKAVAIVYPVVYIVVGVIYMIAVETSGRRVLAVAAIVRLDPGPMSMAVVIVDLLLNVVVVVAFCWLARNTLRQMEPKSSRKRRYIATLLIVAAYALVGFLNASANVVSGELHDREWEANWKWWWLSAALMDGVFAAALLAVTIVWFPSNATENVTARTFEDQANYDGVVGPGQQLPDDSPADLDQRHGSTVEMTNVGGGRDASGGAHAPPSAYPQQQADANQGRAGAVDYGV